MALNKTMVLRGEWAEVNQIWPGHKTIIGVPVILLHFKYSLLLHFETRATERRLVSKIEGRFALFDTLQN